MKDFIKALVISILTIYAMDLIVRIINHYDIGDTVTYTIIGFGVFVIVGGLSQTKKWDYEP